MAGAGANRFECPEAPQGAHGWCPRCRSLSPALRSSQPEYGAASDVLKEPPRECTSLSLSPGAGGAVGSQAPTARSKPGTHVLCSLPFLEEKTKAKQDFSDVLKVRP